MAIFLAFTWHHRIDWPAIFGFCSLLWLIPSLPLSRSLTLYVHVVGFCCPTKWQVSCPVLFGLSVHTESVGTAAHWHISALIGPCLGGFGIRAWQPFLYSTYQRLVKGIGTPVSTKGLFGLGFGPFGPGHWGWIPFIGPWGGGPRGKPSVITCCAFGTPGKRDWESRTNSRGPGP